MTIARPQIADAPGWPRHMTAQTLALYLDMGSTQTLYRHMKTWDSFPEKDPRTGRWDRDLVDLWLATKGKSAQSPDSNWRSELTTWATSR